jgi:cytochrome c oxidase subunit II
MTKNHSARFGRILTILLFGAAQACDLNQAQSPAAGVTESPEVIEVDSQKYEFSPNDIHVKKGSRVQVRLHTEDIAHGLKLSIYPEGVREDGNPGLAFDHPQDNAKVKKGEERVSEFVAVRAGTYEFKFSVQWGLGHGRMVGKLIVEGYNP